MNKRTARQWWILIGGILFGSIIYGVTEYIYNDYKNKVAKIVSSPCIKNPPKQKGKQFPGDCYKVRPSKEVKAAAEKLRQNPFIERNRMMYGLSLAPVLMTDRLVLRPINSEDIDDFAAILEDEETVYMLAFMPWPFSRRRSVIYLENLSYSSENGNSLYWAITEPKDNRLIGVIGLTLDYGNEHADVHYWLHLKARGKGYMTEAAKRAIDYVFRDLGMHRIDINCLSINRASQRVIEKCGFVFEAEKEDYVKKGEKFESLKYFHLLRRDYFSNPEKKTN